MDLISSHIPLEKEESLYRKNLLSDIRYNLFLNLSKIYLNHFEGIVKIDFNLKEASNIFLDYDGEIKNLIVNNEKIIVENNLNRLLLNKQYLMIGINKLEIKFNSHINADIKRRFTTFSNTNKLNNEPFTTHKIFPCFDQPNLKSDIDLLIYGNKDLTFISNSEIDRNFSYSNQNYDNYSKLFNFQEAPHCKLFKLQEMKKISTHQFCLFAGNFYCMSDPMNENEKSKLHLHFKKGPEIDNNSIETFFNIFSLLREGIQWFEKKLNMAFPYKKIEVVFVPEYKNVATSHPGAVIFIDLKFLKEKCDVLDKEYFKFLLISQISQMWFSHKFSINWWEDSILLDGLNILTAHLFFREKHAYSLIEENTADLIFDNFKTKAIIADKSPDSHKVWMDINDTNDAKVFSDEITCYKGASLLNYLFSLIGDVSFWEIFRNLLLADNITFDEFFLEFEKLASQFELNSDRKIERDYIEQFRYHMKKEGMSRLRCIPETRRNFDLIAILQEPAITINSISSVDKSVNEIYYPYILDLLFIYSDRQEIIENIMIQPKKINLIKLTHNYPNPLAIILNYKDEAHMIQKFNLNSILFFIENPQFLTNNSTKLIIIRDLYEMVKDGDCDPLFYIKFCHSLLNIEKNIYIINRILSNTISIINNYLTPVTFRTQKNEMFKLLSEKYYSNPQFENLKNTMINYMLDVINTNSLENLKFFISSELGISIEEVQENSEINEVREYDLKFLDIHTKFRIVSAIYQNDQMPSIEKENLKKIILNEENGNLNTKYEEIMWNTLAIENNDNKMREGLWKFIVFNEKNMSDEELKFYMKGFNKQSKLFAADIQKYYRKRFFSDFPYVFTEHTIESAYRFYKYFNPCFLTRDKILKKVIKMKSKLRFTEDHNKLRLLMESDIEEMKNRLLLEKIYSALKLYKHNNRYEILY